MAFIVLIRLLLCLNYLGIGVLLNALNAVHAAGLGGVTLRSEDDLAVSSLEAESELACLVVINLKLGVLLGLNGFNSLVFDSSFGSYPLNAFNAVLAGSLSGLNLGSAYNLTIACYEIKLNAGLNFFNNKLAHIELLFSQEILQELSLSTL